MIHRGKDDTYAPPSSPSSVCNDPFATTLLGPQVVFRKAMTHMLLNLGTRCSTGQSSNKRPPHSTVSVPFRLYRARPTRSRTEGFETDRYSRSIINTRFFPTVRTLGSRTRLVHKDYIRSHVSARVMHGYFGL